MAARRPEKLDEAVKGLTDAGYDAQAVAANLGDEDGIKQVVWALLASPEFRFNH